MADLYDMIHPNANDTLTVRSVFIIGPDKKVKLTLTYPASTGRNVDEILRVLDSLQLTADYKVATPVNWKDGEDVIIVPAVSDEDAKERSRRASPPSSPTCGSRPSPIAEDPGPGATSGRVDAGGGGAGRRSAGHVGRPGGRQEGDPR